MIIKKFFVKIKTLILFYFILTPKKMDSAGWDRINMGCQTNLGKMFLILDLLKTAEALSNFVETKTQVINLLLLSS